VPRTADRQSATHVESGSQVIVEDMLKPLAGASPCIVDVTGCSSGVCGGSVDSLTEIKPFVANAIGPGCQ
jgi:hypothetical protein